MRELYTILAIVIIVILTWLILKYVIHFDKIILADKSPKKKKTVAKMDTPSFIAAIVFLISYIIWESDIITILFIVEIIMHITMHVFFRSVVTKEDSDIN